MAKYRYNQEADEALNDLYGSVGATATEHKITILEKELGGEEHNFYAFGGEHCDEAKLGCLEYEYLSRRGLIGLTLV